MLEKRNPLSHTARRAGWVGCNFLLDRLPEEAKIYLIKNKKIINKEEIQRVWDKMLFLSSKDIESRGWTSDVLKVVENLTENFSLKDIYKYENYFKQLHPKNKNIRPKIRQQLQILRDNSIVFFLGKGKYKKKD